MGALDGIKILEMGGIGPGPFSGMMLADMGADVVIIERSDGGQTMLSHDINRRGKRSISLDLKSEVDLATLKKLIVSADVLFEGYRPGVMERLGLGPTVCCEINPKLIYGRMTGWGQEGSLSHRAGHDINYIATTGVLQAMGATGQPPSPPLNLVGDYGGGAMFLVTGILAAYIEMLRSGQGQVVDVAMTDGSALLMSIIYTLDASRRWSPTRQANILDGGAPFYSTYKTKDDRYIAIGAIEVQFYNRLLELLEMTDDMISHQYDTSAWPAMKSQLDNVFIRKTRDEWCELLESEDVCFAPVLDYKEAVGYPHHQGRNTYTSIDGIVQPAPAPRFSRTPSSINSSGVTPDQHRAEILQSWNVLV